MAGTASKSSGQLRWIIVAILVVVTGFAALQSAESWRLVAVLTVLATMAAVTTYVVNSELYHTSRLRKHVGIGTVNMALFTVALLGAVDLLIRALGATWWWMAMNPRPAATLGLIVLVIAPVLVMMVILLRKSQDVSPLYESPQSPVNTPIKKRR